MPPRRNELTPIKLIVPTLGLATIAVVALATSERTAPPPPATVTPVPHHVQIDPVPHFAPPRHHFAKPPPTPPRPAPPEITVTA